MKLILSASAFVLLMSVPGNATVITFDFEDVPLGTVAMVFVNDAALRPARGLKNNETIITGKHTLRFKSTPHLPHGWDAGLLFDETTQTLLC
jgi:hypothetical protein